MILLDRVIDKKRIVTITTTTILNQHNMEEKTVSKKYPGYNESDTSWDDYHRRTGQMTNREFFTSNAKGGFYEGMEWDGEEWVPNAENRAKLEEKAFSNRCEGCGCECCCC